jgi:hypothetical protein
MLNVILPFQILFIPGILALLGWATYRTVFKRDKAVGLVLYIGLVVIVDSYMEKGVYIPGFSAGSIKYSEICACLLLLTHRPRTPIAWNAKIVMSFAEIGRASCRERV